MRDSIIRTIALGAFVVALPGAPAFAQGKAFTWTTRSEEAKTMLKDLQWRIESFQPVPGSAELGKKIVALDPQFAMGVYYLSAVSATPAEGERLYLEARELAKKNASDGERRFIEAMEPVRTGGGANAVQAIPALEKIAADYPGERLPAMIIGQILNGNNRSKEAVAWFRKAQAIGSSPRIEAFLANDDLFAGRYADARAKFALAEKQLPAGSVPFPIRFGVTFSHIYEGNTDAAIKSLETYLAEYKAGGLTQQFPEVFIHNAIARINLEAGRYEAALASYKKGYESVPGSTLAEQEKQTWFARLHHGTARTHARMGRFKEADEGVEKIRQMIITGGELGRQFWPAYHYVAGYVALEKGDGPAALEHLLQANGQDPFHTVLLARAYEKVGRKAEAKAAYERIVASQWPGIELPLAFPEAKKKALTL